MIRTRFLVLAALAIIVPACSGSSSNPDSSDPSGSSTSATNPTGTSTSTAPSSSNTSSGSPTATATSTATGAPTASSTADAGSDAGEPGGGCGSPGDTGNNDGVGKYCTQESDCIGNSSAQLCATLGGDPTQTFCTMQCQDQGSTTECGTAATCECQGGQCGCFPNKCL